MKQENEILTKELKSKNHKVRDIQKTLQEKDMDLAGL